MLNIIFYKFSCSTIFQIQKKGHLENIFFILNIVKLEN